MGLGLLVLDDATRQKLRAYGDLYGNVQFGVYGWLAGLWIGSEGSENQVGARFYFGGYMGATRCIVSSISKNQSAILRVVEFLKVWSNSEVCSLFGESPLGESGGLCK